MKVTADGDDWETDPDFEVVHTGCHVGISAATLSRLFPTFCVAE